MIKLFFKKEVLIMGGVHVAFRATHESIYTGVSSKLVLPSTCSCRPNLPDGNKNGAFPEFFHGFYNTVNNVQYGLDTGVLYTTEKNPSGEFRLFVSGAENTVAWYDSPIAVPANRTIYLQSYLEGGYLINRAYSDRDMTEASKIGSLDVSLSAKAYNSLILGCYINREIVLAVNKNRKTQNYELPADCYFSMVEFTETSTRVRQTDVRMTLENTNTWHGKIDDTTPSTGYKADISQLNREYRDYAVDAAAASYDGRLHY